MTTRTTAATTTTTTTTNQLLVHLVVNEVNRVIIFRIAGTSGSSLKPPLILSIHRSVYHAIPARDEDRLVERKRKVFNYVPMTWPCTKVMDLHQGDGLIHLLQKTWLVPQATGISTVIYRVANGTWASSSINPEIGTHFCWMRTCQSAPAVNFEFISRAPLYIEMDHVEYLRILQNIQVGWCALMIPGHLAGHAVVVSGATLSANISHTTQRPCMLPLGFFLRRKASESNHWGLFPLLTSIHKARKARR